MTGIETGKRSVTDRTIKLICTEFGVSEDWLRTGKEPMLVEIDEEDKFSQAFAAASMEEDDFIKALLIEYMDLSKEDRKIVKQMILRIAERTKKQRLIIIAAQFQPLWIKCLHNFKDFL